MTFICIYEINIVNRLNLLPCFDLIYLNDVINEFHQEENNTYYIYV